jgi:hypothetical protein
MVVAATNGFNPLLDAGFITCDSEVPDPLPTSGMKLIPVGDTMGWLPARVAPDTTAEELLLPSHGFSPLSFPPISKLPPLLVPFAGAPSSFSAAGVLALNPAGCPIFRVTTGVGTAAANQKKAVIKVKHLSRERSMLKM